MADIKEKEELQNNNGVIVPPRGSIFNVHVGSFGGDVKEAAKTQSYTLNLDDPIKKRPEPELTWFAKYGGMAMTLFAGLNFTIASIIASILYQNYDFNSYSTTFWRYLGCVIPGIPLFLYYQLRSSGDGQLRPASTIWPLNKVENLGNVAGLLVRGTLGCSAVVFRYYAIQYIPVGDMNVISYSTPILVTVLAHIFLGEKCGVIPIFLAIFSLLGVFVISRPPVLTGEAEFDTDVLIGTGLACGSLVCGALIIIVTRKIRKVHFSVMTLAFGLIGVTEGYLLTLTSPSTHPFRYPSGNDINELLTVIGLGVVSCIGQMSIVIATQFEQAGPVALLRSNDVILGFILQYFVLGVVPTVYSAIGGSIVLTMIILMGFRKWLSTLDENHPKRKTFGILLR